MKKAVSIFFVFLSFLFAAQALAAEKLDSPVDIILGSIKEECHKPYQVLLESGAKIPTIKGYNGYIHCLKSKIAILTKDYFIKDDRSVNYYDHKQFMEALNLVGDKYGAMMQTLYMNGKGLLDEEGKRSWEGTEAYANMYSEIAEFYEGLLASILRKYEDSKMPFPPGIK